MKALLFDLDNTLLECGEYYIEAQKKFVEALYRRTGLDKDFIFNTLSSIDVSSASLKDGFLKTRFPRSFKAASLALEAIAGLQPDVVFAADMEAIGNSVFSAPYPVYPGVTGLLDRLKSKGWPLFLVTKGDQEVQLRKLRINGLDRYFDHNNTHIVLQKNEALFRNIALIQGITPKDSWVVGDSLRDDIGPGKSAGFRTIEISSKTGRWGYETQVHVADHTVYSVTEIESIVGDNLNPVETHARTSNSARR